MQFATLLTLAAALGSATVFAAPITINKERSPSNVHNGIATWYTFDGTAGACDNVYHSDNDWVVAMNAPHFGSATCGKDVVITANGKTLTAKVVDECPECPAGNLDLAKGFWHEFESDYGVGVFDISWYLAN